MVLAATSVTSPKCLQDPLLALRGGDVAKHRGIAMGAASVPNPKFAASRGELEANFGFESTLATIRI